MAQLVARVDTLTPSHRAYVFEGFEKPEVFQAIIPGASGEWEAQGTISAVTNQSHWLAQLELRLAHVGEGEVASSHASGSTGHSWERLDDGWETISTAH